MRHIILLTFISCAFASFNHPGYVEVGNDWETYSGRCAVWINICIAKNCAELPTHEAYVEAGSGFPHAGNIVNTRTDGNELIKDPLTIATMVGDKVSTLESDADYDECKNSDGVYEWLYVWAGTDHINKQGQPLEAFSHRFVNISTFKFLEL